MKMKIYLILLVVLTMVGCGGKTPEAGQPQTTNMAVESIQETSQKESSQTVETEKNTFQQIFAEEAKQMMDEQEGEIVLDVREQSEFDAGHIPGAVLLPVGLIDEASAAAVIPTKDTIVLVYCRSGNRSKQASTVLAELGYTQVYEFGGIKDWPYEVEKE